MATATANNLGPLTTEFPVPQTCTSTFLGDNGQAGPGNIWIQFGTTRTTTPPACAPKDTPLRARRGWARTPRPRWGRAVRPGTAACAGDRDTRATRAAPCSRRTRTSAIVSRVRRARTTTRVPRARRRSSGPRGAGVFARGPVIRRSGDDPSWPGFPVQTTTTAAAPSKTSSDRDGSGSNPIKGGAEITPTPTGMPSSSGSDVRFTTVTQPASPGGNGGISDVAKIAIGVGVAVGVAALIAVAVFVFWRRKRSLKKRQASEKAQQEDLQHHNYFPSNDPYQAWQQQQQQQRHEQKYVYPQIYEKPAESGPWIFPEAQGNPVSELAVHPVELDVARR
ncbi:hypothetical protein PG996_007953 [Apiospora saccharicola]|uniref:Uncharacterized protein n=1 Tax=Apiospora saccharicola TaxID=335842 RepID=A0ABR1UWJ1_9PEZI